MNQSDTVEYTKAQADELGAFSEDAMSVEDAESSMKDAQQFEAKAGE